MTRSEATMDTGRIGWLERKGDDFPYYGGRPVGLTGLQWILLMVGVALGFVVLVFGLGPFTLGGFVPAMLYVAIPLGVLSLVSRGHWRSLFRRLVWRDVFLMIGFAILNVVVTLAVGFVLLKATETTKNAAVVALAGKGTEDIVLFYARTLIQLLGEEVMTILPFLALLYVLANRMGTGRVTAILVAWVLTAVLFAAEHLPTYGWNVVQALGGVGVARLVLTLPYIVTKNLWVSTGAHVLNDWITFTVSLLGASVQDSAG